ncbi:MAG TPA: FtsK/SpoIIIE domain-containing protein [Pseudonocardiaceae bacterium]|nr:FtsK/SpoIIIE domain-containing protein [Pseudonocardiaceae bacterium]
MSKRTERRRRIEAAFEEFRRAVEQALTVASREQARAAREHARTMVASWLRAEGVDRALAAPSFAQVRANPDLADVIAEAVVDRERHFEKWTADGPRALADLVRQSAPGAAGEPWQQWLGRIGTADGTGSVPELWRIGTAVADSAPEQLAFPVAVPLLDAAHLHVSTTTDSRTAAESMVESLLLRVLSYFQPGLVHLHLWDTGQLTGPLPGLYPLTRAGLLTVHNPARPQELLDELSEHIRRVHGGVLEGGHTSLRAVSGQSGRRAEPWRIAVLFGNHQQLPDDQQQQLQRIARNGLPCGVQLILVDIPVTVNSPMETVTFAERGGARCTMTGEHATFRPDPPLPRAEVPGACAAIATELEDRRARLGSFADLLPERLWANSSATELRTPVGFHDGMGVDVVLGDSSPHALVGGPSGSGKTNFLYAMLGGLAARYSPDELELYLLDFKEGVSFAQFAPGRKDPSWLPHARLVGVNVNTDREFGVALLRFLADQMRARADAAKRHEVTKLEELRGEDPDGRWPRIVAVIDEFQYLFAERDTLSSTAAQLLEDVARRGRSQGIHLVLSSQDVAGIEAFWGKPAIFEQFILRIALPKARRVLVEHSNDAAVELPRWHAVVNHESGVRPGNHIARIPDATSRGTFDGLQKRLWEQRVNGWPPPRLFDGAHVPELAAAPDFQALRPGADAPTALLGQVIDVAGSAAGGVLENAPGRNVAVIGSLVADAANVLGAAALSVARQHEPGTALFTLCPLIPDSAAAAAVLGERLRAQGHRVEVVGRDGLRELLANLSTELAQARSDTPAEAPSAPRYLVGYAIDAAQAVLERKESSGRSGLDQLRDVLRHGPEHRTHVLGWWRGVARLRATLPIGSVDDVGAWVAFDVQGQELSPLASGQLVHWSPRPGRGLHFDRFTHARPQVIIPFDIQSDVQPDSEA